MTVGIFLKDGVEAEVCADIARRQAFGENKYGMIAAENPSSLRAWLHHDYEETLDKAVYLKRAIAEIDAQQARQAGKPEGWHACGNVGMEASE